MTLNKKVVNYKVVDLVDCYNFHINIISIRCRIKKLQINYHCRVVRHCTGKWHHCRLGPPNWHICIIAGSDSEPAVILLGSEPAII